MGKALEASNFLGEMLCPERISEFQKYGEILNASRVKNQTTYKTNRRRPANELAWNVLSRPLVSPVPVPGQSKDIFRHAQRQQVYHPQIYPERYTQGYISSKTKKVSKKEDGGSQEMKRKTWHQTQRSNVKKDHRTTTMPQTSRAHGANPTRKLEGSEQNVSERKNAFIFSKCCAKEVPHPSDGARPIPDTKLLKIMCLPFTRWRLVPSPSLYL